MSLRRDELMFFNDSEFGWASSFITSNFGIVGHDDFFINEVEKSGFI